MKLIAAKHEQFGFIIRSMLLVGALCMYFIDPDDVVWRFIKASPHARLLEHICFGIAAGMLGLSLLLEVKSSAQAQRSGFTSLDSFNRTVFNGFLRAIGIGSLMPLPGFLVLVSGETFVSLLLCRREDHAASQVDTTRGGQSPSEAKADRAHAALSAISAVEWRTSLKRHIGLCCAFLSMIVFSIVLIDRAADVMFAITALVSVLASFRREKVQVH